MLQCSFCGKSTLIGINTTHKHSGAWAMRAPKSQKLWKPNLKYLRVELPGGSKQRVRLCVACIKQYRRVKTQAAATPVPSAVSA